MVPQVAVLMPVPSVSLPIASTDAKSDDAPTYSIDSNRGNGSNQTVVSQDSPLALPIAGAPPALTAMPQIANAELSQTPTSPSSDTVSSVKPAAPEVSNTTTDTTATPASPAKQVAAVPAPAAIAIPSNPTAPDAPAQLLQMTQAAMPPAVPQSMPQLSASAPIPTHTPTAGTSASDKLSPGSSTTTMTDASRPAVSSAKGRPTASSDPRSKVKSTAADNVDDDQSTDKKSEGASFVAKLTEASSQAASRPADHVQTPAAPTTGSATPAPQPPASINDLQGTKTATPAPLPAPLTPGIPDVKSAIGVNSAQLLQSVHQSEMKLGMHSVEFGNISINTSLNHQAISAQISTEHPELSRALAMHLSAIEEKLGNAYGVNARVELRDSGTLANTNSQQHSGQQQPAASGKTFTAGAPRATSHLGALTPSTASSLVEDARLDIRI